MSGNAVQAWSWVLLVSAGAAGGFMNALAGGGSFLTLPALMVAGLPALAANASGATALLPGSLSSAWIRRRDVEGVGDLRLREMLAVSGLGGVLGAVLLLATPASAFDRIVPWLLLIATLVLAFGPRLRLALLRSGGRVGRKAALATHLLLGVYGGYFGGGVGFLVMAFWAVVTDQDLKRLTPARIWTSVAMNAAAVIYFSVVGAVRWPETLAVLLGALGGGYAGAHWGRRLPAPVIQVGVIVVSFLTTAGFFLRLSC